MKDADDLDTPKIRRILKVTHYSKVSVDFTHRVIGVQGELLTFVIREDSAFPVVPLHILTNQIYSGMHGSVEGR